jgi:drug/metabolite transporter (DMT)-like permease
VRSHGAMRPARMRTLDTLCRALQVGFFERKAIPWRSLLDLTIVYVGYIVLGNLSIKLNPVGFYQIIKALIPPAVLLVTSCQARRVPSGKVRAPAARLLQRTLAAAARAALGHSMPGTRLSRAARKAEHKANRQLLQPVQRTGRTGDAASAATCNMDKLKRQHQAALLQIMAAVALLTVGVVAATVTDDEVMGNMPGMATGVACVFATAGYNILAGSKQTQLGASAPFLAVIAP